MKRPRSTKATRSESGQVLVIVSLIIVTLIACTALASDVGFLRNLRRQMQTAADAAAIAGAREIFSGNDGEVNTAAATDATTNGFTNGVNGVTVTINNPPTNSSYSNINGNAQDVEVIINKAQPTFFMRAMGISTVNVAARAVAGPENSPYCVYLLSPNASPSLNLLSFGTIQASCGLVVDSTSNSAIQDFLVFINDTSTGVVGGISGFSFLFTPTPVTGIAPIGDPLAALTQPTPGSALAGGHLQLIGGCFITLVRELTAVESRLPVARSWFFNPALIFSTAAVCRWLELRSYKALAASHFLIPGMLRRTMPPPIPPATLRST